MPTMAELLASPSQARPATPAPTDDSGVFSSLKDIGGAGLGAVASVGNLLDLPGSSVRDLLAGENPFDQWASPLSDQNRVTGRQLLEKHFGMRANRETGLSGWLSDPGEGLRDLAGFATEIVTDPFGPITAGLMGGTAAGKALAGAASKTHPLVRQVGRGAKYAFDTLPANITSAAIKAPARALRTGRALFDAASSGITGKMTQPIAAAARKEIWDLHEKAVSTSSEAVIKAEDNGFHLKADQSLDTSDPANLMNPRSRYQVRAREDAIYRYLENIEPDDTYRAHDVVTIGETPDLRVIDFTNHTPQGTQVRLVGDDNWYSDTQLKPAFMQSKVKLPDAVKAPLDEFKKAVDDLHVRANNVGYGLGLDQDAYGLYFPRTESDALRRGKFLADMEPKSWRRSLHSLVATLRTSGGRDMMYKGAKGKTVAIQRLFEDKFHQFNIEELDKQTLDMGDVGPDGKASKRFDGMVGMRHVQDIADKMDRPVEEVWNEVVQAGHPTSGSGAYAVPGQHGQFDIAMDGGAGPVQVGQVNTHMEDINGSRVGHVDYAYLRNDMRKQGILDDAFPGVERNLQSNGATRLQTVVDPIVGDKVWKKKGFRADGIVGDKERWVKDLYPGGVGVDPSTVRPVMLTVDQFEKGLLQMRKNAAGAVAADPSLGIQPGVGWWKSFTNVLDPTGESIHNININDTTKNNFQVVTNPQELMNAAGAFGGNEALHNLALAHLHAGSPVYIGKRIIKKGDPAEFMMLVPTKKAKIDSIYKKALDNLKDNVSKDPLLEREGMADTLHQAIGRNYGHEIDKWMPEVNKDGNVVASNMAGDTHADSISGWQKTYPYLKELHSENKFLTKPARTLLQLSDESLSALQFSKEVIEDIRSIRDEINAKAINAADIVKDEAQKQSILASSVIKQDTDIPLVDRHRALAEEVTDHVMKRALPIYNYSAPIAGSDYLKKNGTAVVLVESTQKAITAMRGMRDTVTGGVAGSKIAPGGVDIKYDPNKSVGQTLGDVLEPGRDNLFGGSVNSAKFLESTRQQWIGKGYLKDTIDPEEIAKQFQEIKAISAPADVWHELRTYNEISGAAGLPELEGVMQKLSSFANLWKAGMLATAPATAVRDGSSSFFNAVIMGDMNPVTAIYNRGKDAASFARGGRVDPGEGVIEVERFLKQQGLESNTETRAAALLNLWNAHHFGGSVHPNTVTADAAKMADADSSMSLLSSVPNPSGKSGVANVKDMLTGGGKSFKENVKGIFQSDGAYNPLNVAGTHTTDAAGRRVQRSTNNAVVSIMNAFRTNIDTTNRALFVLDRIDKTKSIAEAFAASDRILLNAHPKNFTRFEHQYLKSIIPFYSFMRQSIPMFLDELIQNPGGKLGQTVRATRHSQGDSEGYVPFEYQDTTAIGLGKEADGSIKYLTSLGLMHEDAVKYAGNMIQGDVRGLLQKAISSVNPVAKWATEYSTNTSLFSQGPMGGRRLNEMDPTIGRIATNLGLQELAPSGRARPVGTELLESIAAASPLSRILSSAKMLSTPVNRSGAIEKVARLLTGARVETVTPEKITLDVRDRLNALQVKAGARPLTLVSGTKGLKERMLLQGDKAGVAQLERIEKLLAALKKRSGS